jgi:hypothetical protein
LLTEGTGACETSRPSMVVVESVARRDYQQPSQCGKNSPQCWEKQIDIFNTWEGRSNDCKAVWGKQGWVGQARAKERGGTTGKEITRNENKHPCHIHHKVDTVRGLHSTTEYHCWQNWEGVDLECATRSRAPALPKLSLSYKMWCMFSRNAAYSDTPYC